MTVEECFTYIDRMLEDEASFMNWLADKQRLEQGVLNHQRKALGKMLDHPAFPEFCRIIGAEPNEWGQESEHADYEVSIFEEFLVERERKAAEASIRGPTDAEIQEIRALDVHANAETQIALELHCACAVFLRSINCWVCVLVMALTEETGSAASDLPGDVSFRALEASPMHAAKSVCRNLAQDFLAVSEEPKLPPGFSQRVVEEQKRTLTALVMSPSLCVPVLRALRVCMRTVMIDGLRQE